MKNIPIILLYLFIIQTNSFAQSYNADNSTLINFVKRMYATNPFEGARMLSGDDGSYYIAAITLSNQDNAIGNPELAEKKAQTAAKSTFAEPSIKFQMLASISDEVKKSMTYLFSFTPLSVFVKDAYAKQSYSGAKIISTPKCNYFVSVVSLDSQKYISNPLMMDRVASIKAKQQANVLFNGSTISSDLVIKTDENSNVVTSTEIIKEQSMGFVEGLELLTKYSNGQNKVFIYYRELEKK
jgi:hypothetical protein